MMDFKLLQFCVEGLTPSFLFGAAGMTTISVLSGLHSLFTNITKYERDKKRTSSLHMKAVGIRSYNGITSIEVRGDLAIPKILNEDEVLIKVMAAGFNPIDLKVTWGYGRAIRSHLRKYNKNIEDESMITLGRECSGVVLDTGTSVTSVRKGDSVWAVATYYQEGLMAEYVVVKEEQVSLKPRNLSFEEAASFPFTAIQAWNAISNQAKLTTKSTKGKRVLVHAGNSSIGLFAMQLLKSWGANLTTTVPTAGLPMCHLLDVDDVIVYSVLDFETELRRRKRFDIVINTIGTVIHQLCMDVSVPGGKVITFVTSPILSDKFGVFIGLFMALISQAIAWIKKVKHGMMLFRWDNVSYNKEYLIRTCQLTEQKRLCPILEKIYEMDDAVYGFQELAQHDNVGKTVLRISSTDIFYE